MLSSKDALNEILQRRDAKFGGTLKNKTYEWQVWTNLKGIVL